jgi:oligopeptide transport system substrate-binding protein
MDSTAENIVLEKNDQYWDKDAVKLKKINMAMVNDPNTGLNMYKKGELDFVGQPLDQISTDAIPSLKKEGLNIDPFASVYLYKFNTEAAPLNNVNIRKALTYAPTAKRSSKTSRKRNSCLRWD